MKKHDTEESGDSLAALKEVVARRLQEALQVLNEVKGKRGDK